MNKEFKLDNYIWNLLDEKTQLQTKAIPVSKVKEFIRLLKEQINRSDYWTRKELELVITNLAGEKLI